MSYSKMVSAIILSIISGIMSYLIINHYTSHQPEPETQEVNVYFILDPENTSKIIQDKITKEAIIKKDTLDLTNLDLTKTKKQPMKQLC